MPDLKYITTDKNSGFPEYLDFATLRKLGIQHVAELSGKIWTDHNLHDPGITILEALCYVLTDLDYRTKLDFKDLIAAPAGAEGADDNFYTAAKILGNNPLTIADIRRMLIDIKGVRNAWLIPINEAVTEAEYSLVYDCEAGVLDNTRLTKEQSAVPLKGLYRVYIEPDDVYAAAYEKDACGNDVFPMDTVLTTIDQRLHAHRNLCEDFPDVVVLEKEPISLCLHIELAANYNPDDVLLNIYSSIQDFLSPAPVYYNLQQLLEKGRSMEEIFEGRPYDFEKDAPLQQNGFIDVQELESLERITELHASDLYRIIMQVPGVAGITRLMMTSFDEDGYALTDAAGNPVKQEGEEWCLHLKKDHRPVLSPETSNVIFFRNKLQFGANTEVVNQRYKKAISDYSKFPKAPAALDTIVPKGRQLDLAQYTSVQYEFPKVYMIGKNDVPGDSTAARKAQALQLQAYLLFFDRMLADYFSQLSAVRKLFSLQSSADARTYFPADLNGIPQLPSLLRYKKQLPKTTAGNTYNGMQLAYEPNDSDTGRKEYDSMYLRDEMIRRIISECSNNSIVRRILQREDNAYWFFQLTDKAGKVLLESTIFFDTEIAAEQAALDVVFLAALSGSYVKNNNRQDDIYSFDLVYNDAGDTEMLTALYETAEQYQERKERFLNHLLARFSEDFTDYALMMYNISGRKNDPARNIADKADFLSAYPETSANRALAFNYKDPGSGFPVCGLEKRVAGLMGIRQSPSASLNNFDLVHAEKRTGFICKLPEQQTPLFISDSMHNKEQIAAIFSQFLELGKNKANYTPYGCIGEGVYGFSIQSPATAKEWISAKCSIEYTTAEERDTLIDWFVHFFEDDGQYKIYPQTQEGYYFLLPDDYGKTLLKSKQGFDTQELALSQGYDCLALLQEDVVWEVEPDVAAGNFRIIIVQQDVQIAYHPQTYGTEDAALQKIKELQEYFRQHYLVYQREASELYNWRMTHEGQAAWEGILPYKDIAQLPVAFVQFVELASKAENYRIVQTGDGVFRLQVVRTEEGEEEGMPVSTVISVHLSSFVNGEAAQQVQQTYVNLFSGLRLTVSGAVTSVSAATYYFRDLDAPKDSSAVLLTTVHPVPDGPTVTQVTRGIIRYASNPKNVTIKTLDNCHYIVQVQDDNGVSLAESNEVVDHAAAAKLLERILLKAAQDTLWVERGAAIDAYGLYWEDATSATPLLQSIHVWETREGAVTAFMEWLLNATDEDIYPEQQAANGYGYNIFSKDKSPFARQAQWFAGAEERDVTMLLLQQQLAALQTSTGWSAVTLYHYYFKISDQEGLLLQEPHYYTSYDAVRTAFYDTVQYGKQRQYYLLTVQDNCTYSFKIIDADKNVLAIHPFAYTTTTERDAAVERTLRFLQAHGQTVSEVKLAGAWKYTWQWLSCCCWYPETALEGLDEKPEKEDAQKTLAYIIEKLAPVKDNYDIVQEESGFRVFLREGKERVAVHPHWYDCAKEAEAARDRLIAWSGFRLSKIEEGSYSVERDIRTDLYKNDDTEQAFGYRLWDRDFRIARYLPTFESIADREDAIEALLQRYQRRLPSFTALERGSSVVVSDHGAFYYQLRRNDLLLWQSITGYGSADAAAAAFEKECWGLLQRTLKQEYYSSWTPTATQLYLNDEKGQALAVAPLTPGSYEAYIAAVKTRQQFVRKHGVFLNEEGTFSFHIYNSKTNSYEWESVHSYANPVDAENALLEFRQLLRFRGNYCSDDETVGCYYSINLGKVLLDIQQVTRKCEGDKETMTEADAWDRLQVFLDNIDPDNRNLFPYTDYANDCRYAFRLVDDSIYRVAQHTGWYQGMERREEHRMALLADIYCKKNLYGWFVKPANLNTDPGILDCYFKHPEQLNFSDLWMSYGQVPALSQLWTIAEETLPAVNAKLYYYQLYGKVDKDTKVMWQAVSRYNSPALAQAAEARFYVFLLEMARSAASYYYEPMAGCENAYTLYLKDMDGKVIAKAPDVICGEDIENDRATRMFNAMLFPIVETGKGYTFEINNINQVEGDSISYTYAAVWESIQTYDTPEDAWDGLTTACELLTDLRNYQRGDEDACGPFSVTLVNPEGVQAEHPLTYTSLSARDAAMAYVLNAISAEGLHLLEHILMRPRTQQQSYEAWQLELNWYTQRESMIVLQFVNEAVFADAASYVKALQDAAATSEVYVDRQASTLTISFYKKDERLAVAKLDATDELIALLSDLSFVRTAMQSLLANASTEQVSTVVIPIVCSTENAILPICDDVCLCCDEEEETDKENAIYCDRTFLADPYSFWATVVLPAWPQRFRLARFRQFFEDTLRREAPAHIRLNILWVSPQQMLEFEGAWKNWLAALSREESCDYDDSLQTLNLVLKELKNVYPAAYMWDDEGGDDKPLILLDEAMLA